MTFDDYSTVQRLIGNLEGSAIAVEDGNISSIIYDVIEGLDVIVEKYKPEECKK